MKDFTPMERVSQKKQPRAGRVECYNSTMKLISVKIESNRISMIPITVKYAEQIYKEFTPEITKYMKPRSPKNIEETYKYLKTTQVRMEKGEDLLLAVLKKDDKEFLGQCGIHDLNSPTPSLGIWIKKSAQGNGYGREAISLAKKWCDENIKYKYLKYPVDKRNVGSRKIAEALNGEIKREFKMKNESGFILDEVEYWIYPK